MAARRSALWFGYLEAGVKGSPVVRDDRLETGNPSKIYLFNFNKGRILEYRRDIAEPKLRELAEGEADLVDSLRAAYVEARNQFTPRYIPPPPRRKKKPIEIEIAVEDDGDLDNFSLPLETDDQSEMEENEL